jgi:hypothetical protein
MSDKIKATAGTGKRMESGELKGAWESTGEILVTFPATVFVGLPIPVETKVFLGATGLPESAAPFLDFSPPKSGVLPTVAQMWRLEDRDLESFYVIGSNGAGDSIAIDPMGMVFYLNHDAGFCPCYINRDVWTMSETLLRYQQMVAEALVCNGPEAFLDGHVPEKSVVAVQKFLETSDPDACVEGAMWFDELKALLR